MSETIKIVIAGASYAGLCAVNRILTTQSNNTNIDVTIIEPRTAFEYIMFSGDYYPRGDKFWTTTQQDLSTTDTAITTYQSALDDIYTKTSEMFVPYSTMPFSNRLNFKIYYGAVTQVGENIITFTPTPNAVQPKALPTINPTTNDYSIKYDVLLNATGSIATQPIKPLSQNLTLQNTVKKFEKFTNITTLLQSLDNIFTTNDLTIIQSFPETFQTSLQSLLYLNDNMINLLINYYLQTSSDLSSISFSAKKSYVLTCFFLSSYPEEINTIVNNDKDVLGSLYGGLTALEVKSRAADSILTRYVEMNAVRSMLVYRETETQSTANDIKSLPELRILNMVGAGPTAVEMMGFYLDTIYNDEKEKQADDANKRPKLQLNVYTLGKVLGVYPESVGVNTKAHFIKFYSNIADIQFYEGAPWDTQTPQKQIENGQKNDDNKIVVGSIMNTYAFGFQRTEFTALNTSDQLLTQESIDLVKDYLEIKKKDDEKITSVEEFTSKLPSLTFAFGDAWVKKGIGPTARIAHSQSNYVVDNMFIYINQYLIPTRAKLSQIDSIESLPLLNLLTNFTNNIESQMYGYPLPASPSFAVGTLGQFGGFFSAPHYNLSIAMPFMSQRVASMKANVRTTILNVFTQEPTTSWAPFKWNMIEFFSGHSDRWM